MTRIKFILLLYLGYSITGYSQSKSKFVIYDQAELILQNARVVDVLKGIVLEGYSVLISNGKIIVPSLSC